MGRIIANYRSNPNPRKGTIIDLIVNNPCYKTEDEIAADVLVYLTAGYDTTAYSIAFTLLELARHPHEQEKVRKDLQKVATMSTTSSVRDSTTNNIKRSEVLQRAIKESMRLNPVSAFGSARLCARDYITKKEGHIIPKGTVVIISMMLLHR